MNSYELFPNKKPSLSTLEVDRRLSRIYDHLYANAPVRTPAAIAREVRKLLHLAIYLEDVNKASPAFLFTPSEVRDFSTNRTDRAEKLASEVRRYFTEMNAEWNLYEKGESIFLADSDISYSIGQLSGISFSDAERDILGDAVEVFRSKWVKQQGGQYFTDQRVTRLAMKLLEFDPWGGDDLVDICAGTGGFIQAALHHIRVNAPKPATNGYDDPRIVDIAERNLHGAEIDQEVADVANAALVARLGPQTRSIVCQANSLLARTFDDAESQIRYSTHLCAASNPPFGTKITIKDPDILEHYDLAHVYKRGSDEKTIATQRLTPKAPDILFLEQNLRILKPGKGRLALVTPYQILSGPQTLYIREWLLKQAQVLATIDLPSETFQPHTGTKTCLLVVRRREEPLDEVDLSSDPEVFMALPKWIGHDRRGNPVFERQENGRESDSILSDFEEVGTAFKAFKSGDSNLTNYHRDSFAVNPIQIATDPELHLNARFYQPSRFNSTFSHIQKQSDSDPYWTVTRISDVVDRIFFPTRFKRNYAPPGGENVPFLGGTHISQMLINNFKWLRGDDPRLPELRVNRGWVLVTRSGSTGIVSLVPPAWDGFAISEHVIRIVPRDDTVPGEYIFAFLRTKIAQEILQRGIFGSVIDEITPDYIGSIEMPVPKDSELLDNIVRKIRLGESAKQIAIDSLQSGVNELDSLLKSYI